MPVITSMHMCINAYACARTFVRMCVFVCVRVCMCARAYVCVCMRMLAYAFVCPQMSVFWSMHLNAGS